MGAPIFHGKPAPCYDCKYRRLHCHAECTAYKGWRAERDRILAERDFAGQEADTFLNDSYEKYRRGHFSGKKNGR